MRILLLGNTAGSIQTGMILPVMPLFLVSRGFSFAQMGFLFSLVAAAAVVLRLTTARHQHAFAGRTLIIAFSAVPALAFPLYLVVNTPVGYLLVTTAAMSAGVVYGWGYQVWVARSVHPAQLTQAFTLFRFGGDLGYGAGLIVGGFLMAQSFTAVFYVASVTSLITTFSIVWLLFSRRLPRKRQALHPTTDMATVSAHVSVQEARVGLIQTRVEIANQHRRVAQTLPIPRWAVRNVYWVSLHMLLFGNALFMYPVFFPQILIANGLPAEWIGIVIAASWIMFGLTEVVGAVIADATKKYRVMIVASLLACAALNALMWWGTLSWIIAAWIGLGVADGMGRPVTQTYLATSITQRAVGFGFAVSDSMLGFTRILGPLLFSFVITAFGLRSGLLGASMLMLLSALPILMLRSPTREILPNVSQQ